MSNTKMCLHCYSEIPIQAAICNACETGDVHDLSLASKHLVIVVIMLAGIVAYGTYETTADVCATMLLGFGTVFLGAKLVFKTFGRMGARS
jgi:hypothetical protein